MGLIFRTPTLNDKAQVLAFRSAYLACYDEVGIHGGLELQRFHENDFEKWLDYVYAPAGVNWFGYDKVADDTVLIYQENYMVGIVNIRYELTEFLLQVGGHIGYSTHPDFQGQGIASAALAYGVQALAAKGIYKVLVTCHRDNVGSARVIEKNGGVLENTLMIDGREICRYWIETAKRT